MQRDTAPDWPIPPRVLFSGIPVAAHRKWARDLQARVSPLSIESQPCCEQPVSIVVSLFDMSEAEALTVGRGRGGRGKGRAWMLEWAATVEHCIYSIRAMLSDLAHLDSASLFFACWFKCNTQVSWLRWT
ncbi:hypothetical protein LIA77_05278 [Sarocladium implicatum]|nr:hypothetical protein LIA77_05278 [Sarocladium implicatum]